MRDDEQTQSGGPDADRGDDLDVEIVDLETLDDADERVQKSPIPAWSVPVLQWQHTFNRRRWHVITTTCSLLLICLVLALNLHTTSVLLTTMRNGVAARLMKQEPKLEERFPTPVNITPSLVIPLSQMGFSCVTSEAWSPDSTSIALLGYTTGCEYDSDNAVGLATIQDARTGQRLVQLHPDALIEKAFYTQFPAIHDGLLVYYEDASWSPDKIHLALLFDIHTKSQIGGAQFSGVLLFDSKHKNTRVLLQQDESGPSYQVSDSSYMEWDILRDDLVPTPILENDDRFVFKL